MSALHYFFFFNDTATTEIYTLSLHDALPILMIPITLEPTEGPMGSPVVISGRGFGQRKPGQDAVLFNGVPAPIDRKSTRLNSSHDQISYAVFCLKKKKKISIIA